MMLHNQQNTSTHVIHGIYTPNLKSCYHLFFYLTGKEKKPWTDEMTYPRSHGCQGSLGVMPSSSNSRISYSFDYIILPTAEKH